MIRVGDRFPSVTIKRLTAEGGKEEVDSAALVAGKRAVIFSLPGAFTPTCSRSHLPGFVARAAELRAKGVDVIACLSVNDPYVMQAWGLALDPTGSVTMIPDWDASLTRALGLDYDASASGLGIRARRASIFVENGVVAGIDVEESNGKVEVSGADACLTRL
jgi:glutaredoxin/glutathione-dependent peroxiredoxin